MGLARIIFGGGLLFLGRKLYWVFVGGIGFFAGLEFAHQFINGPEWVGIAVGLGVGLVGALLAIFLQSIAIGLAGFLGGGYIFWYLAGQFNLNHGWIAWAAFILGGILGVILVSAVFDWALIIISSVLGAGMILEAFQMASRTLTALLFVVLCAIGIAAQASMLKRRKSR